MAWKLEKKKPWWRVYRRWEWHVILSSYGMVWGHSWTRWGAKRAMHRGQYDMLRGR